MESSTMSSLIKYKKKTQMSNKSKKMNESEDTKKDADLVNIDNTPEADKIDEYIDKLRFSKNLQQSRLLEKE